MHLDIWKKKWTYNQTIKKSEHHLFIAKTWLLCIHYFYFKWSISVCMDNEDIMYHRYIERTLFIWGIVWISNIFRFCICVCILNYMATQLDAKLVIIKKDYTTVYHPYFQRTVFIRRPIWFSNHLLDLFIIPLHVMHSF
jgi:hypothetical protein